MSGPQPLGPAAAAPSAAPELTGRALVTGLGVGALIAVGNVYMGLKTGWWDSGSITASVLAFGVLSAWSRAGRRASSALETNLAQTTATAVGASPAAAGLLGAIPALALLGREIPGWMAAAWGLSLGALGVMIGLRLRRRLLEEEKLPFPTGVATAEVIRAAHGGARSGGRVLLGVGGIATLLTALRDAAGIVPTSLLLPGSLGGAPASAYGLGVAVSPMMAGAGLVTGPRVGLTVLFGAVVAWAGIAPQLVKAGVVADASYVSLAAWLTWPGVGLMLGSAAVLIAEQGRAFSRALRDLRSPAGRSWSGSAVAVAVAASVLVVGLGVSGFGLEPWQAAAALLLAPLLATVCARAAGQTDIAPVGDVGQLTQAGAGLLGGATPAASIGAGAIVSGAAAQTGVSLWALRAGHELGASPRAQAAGLLIGASAGAAVALPAYLLLTAAHGVGTEALPVPGAQPWRAVALAAGGGLSGVPQGALAAAAAAFALGLTLELLGRTRVARLLPTPASIGMGFIAPASYSAAIAVGAISGGCWRALRPDSMRVHHTAVGAGAIAGESLSGVASAALAAAGLLAR